jgi:phage terminase large subunit
VLWPNGSILRFGYCENESDVYQYQGGEYLFIGLDELTFFTLKQWQFLTSRNRHPGQFATMAGATNPGNIGHKWVKALWIDKTPAPGMDEPEKYNPADYDFIRAYISDNPIYANDQNYLRTLDGLGKALRTAMLEGLWDVFAGQYFDVFLATRHVAKRSGSDLVANVCERVGEGNNVTYRIAGTKKYRIESWWPKWVSLDWGFKHNAAIYWHTTAPDGTHITYREWVVNNLTPRMLGEGIAERSLDSAGRVEKIHQFFLSPDAFADRTGESTIAELIRDVACRGDRLPYPAQASDDRIGGWQLLYQLLEADKWLIAEDCPKLIDSLPTLIRDEKRPEDIKKVDGDDEADSARYGLYSRLGAAKVPVEARAAAAVEGVTDNTARAFILERFYAEEEVKQKPIPLGRRHMPKKKFGL